MKKTNKLAVILTALIAGLCLTACNWSDENPFADAPAGTPQGGTPQGGQFDTKTSILSGLDGCVGANVWGSGSDLEKLANGTYKSTANTAESEWGKNLCVFPVCFGAGDLDTFTHVLLEADISKFELGEGTEEYPAIELKVANDNDSKAKVINVKPLFANGKAEIPLSSVDFLAEATKIMFTFRGTGAGYVIISAVSKAK